MTSDNPSSPAGTALAPGLFGELEKNWGWLLAYGAFSTILGTIGMGMTFLLTEASVLFFAALLIVGGVFQVLQAIKCNGWRGTLLHVLIALLYVAAGLLIVLHPVLTAIALTLTLGGVLIMIGIMRVVLGVRMRPASGWYWPVIAGAISLLLGGLIIAEWPESGFWVIGLFVAVELIFNGWSYVFIALSARAAGKAKAV